MQFPHSIAAPFLCFALASCAQSQPAAKLPLLPLRTLIISGGPTPDSNQYAIESNARYVEKLTARARSRRVLFADGQAKSRTISTFAPRPDDAAQRVLAWLLDAPAPEPAITYRASGLKRIDGPATPRSIAQNVEKLAREVKPGERALLYFTGHGTPGRKTRMTITGIRVDDDFQNTKYAAWNYDNFSTQDLAQALRGWPAKTPLVLVMVQCHSGGFANLLWDGAKPGGALLSRDFCGFFAAIGERQSSGCTSEVDEVDYQDFTTHFFAALSGLSRDGRKISGADYDRNGAVSMLEALAWTYIRDNSIDTPLCTSDAYLRSIWNTNVEPNWVQTPYGTLVKGAAPWQRAILDGLSRTLKLSGENRVPLALRSGEAARKLADDEDASFPGSDAVWQRFREVEDELSERFSGLEAPRSSARFRSAQGSALRYLTTRKADVALLDGAMKTWSAQSEAAETREAQCIRFVRACRTLWLENRLKNQGTAAQKAAFARIRAAESRNPFL